LLRIGNTASFPEGRKAHWLSWTPWRLSDSKERLCCWDEAQFSLQISWWARTVPKVCYRGWLIILKDLLTTSWYFSLHMSVSCSLIRCFVLVSLFYDYEIQYCCITSILFYDTRRVDGTRTSPLRWLSSWSNYIVGLGWLIYCNILYRFTWNLNYFWFISVV
jgi:hypothetical protein